MKINGYKLQSAIKQAQERREFAEKRFHGGLFVFPEDKKPSPVETAAEILRLEAKVAELQAAQAAYNLQIKVTVDGSTFSLHEAVKLAGGASRVEKLWKEALDQVSGDGRGDRYYDRSAARQRSADAIVAAPQVSIEEAEAHVNVASKFARALREQIAAGNATEIDLSVKLD